jgi:putative ABC transport system permease protein
VRQKDPILPGGIHRLLRTFLRDDLLDEVTGDLHEMYKDTRRNHSRFVTNIIAWYQAINYLRPFAMRKKSRNTVNSLPMYKSYLVTALRNMVKNKMSALLNILGLSIGVTVTIVITLWVLDELSYEKQFANYERIGRVIQNVTNNGEVQTWYATPLPLSEEIRKNYGSDFSRIAVTTWPDRSGIEVDSTESSKTGVFAEPDLAKMLSLKMIYGSLDAVDDPKSILLSKSASISLFGKNDPIGKQMRVEGLDVKVGGVYEDIGPNSDFSEVDFFGPWDTYYNYSGVKNMDDPWRPNSFATYVQLNDNATFAGASARIKDAKYKMVNEALKKKNPALFVHPMSEWHLKSAFANGKQIGGRIQYVILFSIVGVFVLFMACINFMNLSTARSEKRAKEVGIRKAIGSLRSQLISQFLAESILTVFLSLLVALLLTQITLPFFNLISEKNMSMPWTNSTWWASGLIFTLLIGLVAGSYPALYLSSMGLGRAVKNANGSSMLRKTLVTIQFTVSVVLIIGTAVVYLQIQHAKNRPLGYNSDGLVAVQSSAEIHEHFVAIRNELKSNGAVVDITESAANVTTGFSSTSRLDWKGKDPNLSVDFAVTGASAEFGETVGWHIIMGRDFSRDRLSDSSAMILNKAALQLMGLTDPVGEIIRWAGEPFEIVGVIDNMIVQSPYAEPGPGIYLMASDDQNMLLFRLNPERSASESLATIESVYKKYNPEGSFDYEFTDVSYARKFGNEERVGTLATTLACLAIFISCLGIFGLSSFTAERRTKEIGVRKVLGATTFDLWRMMSKDFVLLVAMSCVIAVPIAYIVLNNWLENFKYHMSVPLWTFFAATGATLMITLITVSWHTFNAAGSNPVKSLRIE